MIRRPPRSTRTDPLLPYPAPVRSPGVRRFVGPHRHGDVARDREPPVPGFFDDREGGVPRHAAMDLDEIDRSEEHTSELQSLMRTSYAVFCLKKKIIRYNNITTKPT